MEEFLPSDVARAVYGYLLSEGCEEAAKVFLETSANLTECKQRVKNGKRITLTNTLLLGRNLTELLNITCSVHSLVIQANKKQQTDEEKDEGWTHLFEELRSFVLAENTSHLTRDGNNSNSQVNLSKHTFFSRSEPEGFSPLRPVSQPESQNFNLNSQPLDTPKRPSLEIPARVSLAENYKNLVEECHKGLDLSLSPEKVGPSNKSVLCSSRPQPNTRTTAPETMSCCALEVDNQSAVAAIAGIAPQVVPVSSNLSQMLLPGPNLYQVVSSMSSYTSPCPSPSGSVVPRTVTATSLGPLEATSISSSLVSLTSTSVPSATPTPASFVASQPGATAVTSCFPQPIVVSTHSGTSGFQLDGISRLPDPPIILLNEQNQQIMPFDSNDQSASFFGLPPNAASTPHLSQTTHYAPQDTAIIIYPPLVADLPPKTQEKRRTRPIRSTRLRQLLPKAPRKDPPDIVHVRIMPQQLIEKEDEDNENDSVSDNEEGDNSDNGPAEELPNISTKEQIKSTAGEEIPLENRDTILENSIVTEKTAIPGETVPESSTKGADLSNKKREVNTPKPPLLKKNISRSTPRRNSHVRALSFNTPHKPMLGRKANTSPKMPKIQFSPRSSKLNHVKRSSLFKSPPSPKNARELSRLTEEDEAEESEVDDSSEELTKNSPLAKVPIATRSPAPKLSSAWKEVNDVTITEKSVKRTENPKPTKTPKKPVKVTESPSSRIHKPQWDDKIRSFMCGDFVDPVPPPKKEFKEKPKDLAVKKEAVKSKNNSSLVRRSARLTNSSVSPLKNSLKNNNNSKRKRSPQKLKNSPISRPSQSVMNKSPNKLTSKPVSKKKKQFTTPEIVESSSEDTSSSSCEDVSKSVTTNLKRGITSPVHNKSLETRISSPDCQTNQSETNNCKEVVNTGSSIVTSYVLLEDLVLSSNSCFPLAVEDSEKEHIVADPPDHRKVGDDHLKPSGNSNKESVSPKFALPFIPVQETPLKDLQTVFPATPVLNTPYMKTIIQETSVLEEDLLLTPSLPPTPQVVSPHHLGRTPSKPIQAMGTVAQRNLSQPKEVEESNECAQISTDRQIKISCNSKTTNVIESDQQIISDSSTDSIVDCQDKTVVPSSQNRSSGASKNSLTTSSDTSDEEILKSFLNLSTGNKSTFKPTIKTRIIQGPVNSKPKGYINNRKIYTTTDSSDEENNDRNINKARSNQLHQKSNKSLSNLRSMLLEKERSRIERLSKKDGVYKKQKNPKKINSQTQNKTFQKNLPGNIRPSTPIEETKSPVHPNKSPKAKNFSPKEKSNSENDQKNILTPEKIREQLENDLLKQERQTIFGDDLQLSSDSESELEVFEKKKHINKPKTSLQRISKKNDKNKEIFVSDESSDGSVCNSNATGNLSKSVRFETTTEVRIIEESNSVRKSLEAAINTKAFNTLKNITENANKTEDIEIINKRKNIKERTETLNVTTAVNSPELGSNSNLKGSNTLNIDCANSKSRNNGVNALSDESCGNTIGESVKENLCGTSSDFLQTVVSSSSSNKTTNKDRLLPIDTRVSVSKFSLPRAPTPYLESSLSQCDNSSAVTDCEVPKDVNEIDKSEAHISVISNDGTSKSAKPVSLNMPVFDPEIQVGFETDNGTITLSYSKTIFHFEIPNKTDQDIIKTNTRQESLKTGSLRPSKGIDGKRRVKPTPVEEGKYEKLKVDYDIIDGKVISKREERRKSSETDILDFTCSTIDADSTRGSTSNKNNVVTLNRFDFKGSIMSLQDDRKKYENKEGRTETTFVSKETKNLSQPSSGRTSQTKYNKPEKRIAPPPIEAPTKKSETIEHKLYLTEKSEVSIGLKEAKLKRKNTNEPVKQSTKTPDYGSKYPSTQLDKRKEVELRDRRRERDIPERYERKPQSKRYLSRREDDRRRYSERRYHRSPERYHRSHLDRRRDPRKYYAETPSHEDFGRDTRYHDRRRETNRFSKSSSNWKDVDDVKEKKTKNEEEPDEVFDPRAVQQQLTSYSDVEKHSSSDEADSLMDFAVLTKSKKKRLSNSSQSSPAKESLVRSGQSSKRKPSFSGEDISETSQASKKLKMEEKDMREAKSVLKHKMADMLNVLHPDTSNEAS